MSKKKRKFLFGILYILCFLLFSHSLVNIFMWAMDNHKIDSELNVINAIAPVIETNGTENITYVNADEELKNDKEKKGLYWSYINMNLIDIDFKQLKTKNSDTKGWIRVEGTNINYPFVQAKDNKYYLNHSFEKKYNDAGWVFLDFRNDINDLSKNNIIYGHARLNKTMFGTLKNVLTKDWYKNKDNHVIKLSTEKENTLWQIFSVYSIKTETYYITTDFNNDEEFKVFLDTMKKRSKYKFNANVSVKDTILTLSTCHNTNDKIVVHAKLIKKEAKK